MSDQKTKNTKRKLRSPNRTSIESPPKKAAVDPGSEKTPVTSPSKSLSSPISSDKEGLCNILSGLEIIVKSGKESVLTETPEYKSFIERRLSQVDFRSNLFVTESNKKKDLEILDLSSQIEKFFNNSKPVMANNMNTAVWTAISGTGDVIKLADLKNKVANELNEWYVTKPAEVLGLILHGKAINQAIQTARAAGKSFMRFNKNILLNINPKSEFIMSHDLTRTRFMAVLHSFVYEKSLVDDSGLPYSPLVSKVTRESLGEVFGQKKFLLGSGFQYQSGHFVGEMILFYLGCFLLDFIAASHQNHKNYDKLGAMNLVAYIQSELSGGGDTLVAGARNAKDLTLLCFEQNGSIQALLQRAELIVIDYSLGGACMQTFGPNNLQEVIF